VWAPLIVSDGVFPTVYEIARVDSQTKQILARISLSGPYQITGAAAGAGALWVATGGRPPIIHRVDHKSNKVTAKVDVGVRGLRREASVIAGDGAVWVAVNTHDEVFRLDPQTARVTAKIRIGGRYQHNSGGAAVGEGGVWIRHHNWVSRIDPNMNREIAVIPIPPISAVGISIAAGAGGVWVANFLGPIYRIDPRTNQIVATIPVESRSAGMIMAVGENTILASPWGNRTEGAWLTLIDPKTNTTARNIPFGADWPYSVAVGKDAIWACGFGQFWRIPLASL
jgi:DNA-binding beta-propeller fold protein YncE